MVQATPNNQQVRQEGTNGTHSTKKPGYQYKENIALFVTPDHQIYQKPIPIPECGPDNCIVHVRCTGICGSEIHFWKKGHIGDYWITEDLILGHESSGEVIEVGQNVKRLKVGDKVSIEPQVACWKCDQCISGRYNLCPNVKFSGTNAHGTLARYISHPADFLYKMPENMPYSVGALVEPISVSLGGLQRSGLRLGQSTLVCGAGPIGIFALICAKAAGAYPLCIVDLQENRVEWGKKLGAHCGVVVDKSWDEKRLAQEIQNEMGKVSEHVIPEIALECTGAKSSVYSAAYALKNGGVLMQLGNGHNEQSVPFQSLSMREIDLRFLFRYKQTWPLVLRMLDGGILPGAEEIITHSFDVKDALKAFEVSADYNSGAVKVQITDYDD